MSITGILEEHSAVGFATQVRRLQFLPAWDNGTAFFGGVLFVFALWAVATCGAAEPINIGSRLEPLVDDYLIDTITGAKSTPHQPAFREVAIRHDAPWEGNCSCSHIIFQDGPLYRMYYS